MKSPGLINIFSMVPVVVALIILLFIKVATAGTGTDDVTDLYTMGTIVTGVLTSAGSSAFFAE
jgi:hypothetical protein